MKSGASDPFADDEPVSESDSDSSSDSNPDADSDRTNRAEATETEASQDAARTAESASPQSITSESNEPDKLASNTEQFNRSDLPFVLRRDKVKDERDDVHQLFVQSETDEFEETTRRELDDRFEESVYKLDAREAIYLAGMQNLDDAEAVLREWGYDL